MNITFDQCDGGFKNVIRYKDGRREESTLFVDSVNGCDETGDGTQARPYRTFARMCAHKCDKPAFVPTSQP